MKADKGALKEKKALEKERQAELKRSEKEKQRLKKLDEKRKKEARKKGVPQSAPVRIEIGGNTGDRPVSLPEQAAGGLMQTEEPIQPIERPVPREERPARPGERPVQKSGKPVQKNGKPIQKNGKPAQSGAVRKNGKPAQKKGAVQPSGKPVKKGGKADRRPDGSPAPRADAPKKKRKQVQPEPVRTEPIAERLPYPGGFPVYLARYVLFGGERPRAAMRFFNASDILITGLRFRITERDKEGKVIGEYPLERKGLFAEGGGEFEVADVTIGAGCVSIEAQVDSVLSDEYEYTVEGDGVRLSYGFTEREREFRFKKKATYSVKKKKTRYIWVSFLAILMLAFAAGTVAWRIGIFGGIASAPLTQTYTISRDIPEHVEA